MDGGRGSPDGSGGGQTCSQDDRHGGFGGLESTISVERLGRGGEDQMDAFSPPIFPRGGQRSEKVKGAPQEMLVSWRDLFRMSTPI